MGPGATAGPKARWAAGLASSRTVSMTSSRDEAPSAPLTTSRRRGHNLLARRNRADDMVARDMGFYYREARFGEPWDWAGADLVSAWFRRNMRIYSNVLQIIDSPNERVLVIFGTGHLGWLRHSFASNPDVRLRKLAEFAR